MKNLLLLFAVCATLSMFSSCKKDYTCTCTYVDATSGETVELSVGEYPGVKKGTAETACSLLEIATGPDGETVNCTLD